jgi:hypothetical protein
VQIRQSKIWTIQYQDASGLNQTESSKTSDKKKAQHTLRLREGAVARRERIVVEDLSVADAAKLVVSDYQVNERKSLTDALGRIKHVVAFFGSMKLSQVAALDANDDTSLINRLVRETNGARQAVLHAVNPDAADSPMATMKQTLTALLKDHARSSDDALRLQAERQAKRYNRQLNELFAFWATTLAGDGSPLRALGIGDGVDAAFRVSAETAFSRRATP